MVSALAGLILSSGGDPVDRLASEVAEAAGIDEAQAAQAVTAAVDSLVEAGFLVGPPRARPPHPQPLAPPAPTMQMPSPVVSHLARDRPGTSLSPPRPCSITAWCSASTDASLLADIDAYLGVDPCDGEPTMVFDVEPTDDGGVLLQAAEDWDFPDRHSFLVQLPVSSTTSLPAPPASWCCTPAPSVTPTEPSPSSPVCPRPASPP